jgi:hypothetical protein
MYRLLVRGANKHTDVVRQVMTYYVVYIFGMAGLSKNVNLISSGVQYALFVVGTAIVFFYVDKVGRRPLLIYGAIAMASAISLSEVCLAPVPTFPMV